MLLHSGYAPGSPEAAAPATPAPDPAAAATPGEAIRAAMATLDAGGTVDPALAARLEADAEGDLQW